jgi:hypothetical protein
MYARPHGGRRPVHGASAARAALVAAQRRRVGRPVATGTRFPVSGFLTARLMGLGEDMSVPGSYVDADGVVHFPPVSITMPGAGMSTTTKVLLGLGGLLAAGAAFGMLKRRSR